MSGVPRSQVLIVYRFAGAEYSPTFTSPDGFVTLVKSAYFYSFAGAVSVVQLVAVTPFTTVSPVVFEQSLDPTKVVAWEGWLVLNPGDGLTAHAEQSQIDVWVSGAVLAGTNQFPPATRRSPRVEPHG